MKKITAVFCMLCLVLSLTACAGRKDRGETGLPDYTGGQVVGSDLRGSGGARLFSAQPVELPDTGAQVRQAVKAGDGVFLYAKTGDPLYMDQGETCFYFLGANGTVTKAEIQPGRVLAIDGGPDGSAYVLFTDKNGTPILDRLTDAGDTTIFPMGFLADRAEDILGLTVTEEGYLVQTAGSILCYDPDGDLQAELGPFTGACWLIKNPSELVLAIGQAEGTEFQVLGPDYEGTASYKVPQQVNGLSAGSRDGHVFYADAGILYDLDFTTGERAAYANEQASGGTGRFLYLADDLYFETADGQAALYTLAGEEAREIRALSLAVYAPDEADASELLDRVRQFNSTSRAYRIEVVNYGAEDEKGGAQTGLQRLNADIISGKTPDIYDLSCLNALSLMDKGLLEDLLPWFESSEEVRIEDLTESAVRALTYKGALYSLVPSYSVVTVYGPSALASPDTWGPDAFLETANSSAQYIFGPYETKAAYLRHLLTLTGDTYVDLENARCDFVNSSFPAMLALAARLPDDDSAGYASDDWGRVFCGQQLFLLVGSGNLIDALCSAGTAYSGNMAVLGFPSGGNGVSLDPFLHLGMSSSSACKEGVWSFFAYLLSDSVQNNLERKNILPIRNDALETLLDKQLDRQAEMVSLAGFADNQLYSIPFPALTPEVKDRALELIGRIDCVSFYSPDLYDLVLREATPFFQGGISARQAAENIQSKVSIYLSEQFG